MTFLGSGEKSIKCRANDVSSNADRSGMFEWKLGGEVVMNLNDEAEIGDNEYEQVCWTNCHIMDNFSIPGGNT